MYKFLLDCEWLLIQIRFTLILCLLAAWRQCPVMEYHLHAFRSGCTRCRERYAGSFGFALVFFIWIFFENERTMREIPGHDFLLLLLFCGIIGVLEKKNRGPQKKLAPFQYHVWRSNLDTVMRRLLFLFAITVVVEDKIPRAMIVGILLLTLIPHKPKKERLGVPPCIPWTHRQAQTPSVPAKDDGVLFFCHAFDQNQKNMYY